MRHWCNPIGSGQRLCTNSSAALPYRRISFRMAFFRTGPSSSYLMNLRCTNHQLTCGDFIIDPPPIMFFHVYTIKLLNHFFSFYLYHYTTRKMVCWSNTFSNDKTVVAINKSIATKNIFHRRQILSLLYKIPIATTNITSQKDRRKCHPYSDDKYVVANIHLLATTMFSQ